MYGNALRTSLIAASLTVSVAACGGGGGSPKSAAKAPPSKANTHSAPTKGGNPGTISSVTGAKACSLLSSAEANAAYRETLKAGEEKDDVMPSCYFDSPNTDSTDGVALQLSELNIIDAVKKTSASEKGISVEPIPGLGDDAVFQLAPKSIYPVILYVKKGSITAYINILHKGWTAEQLKAADKQLGALVATRIG